MKMNEFFNILKIKKNELNTSIILKYLNNIISIDENIIKQQLMPLIKNNN